MVLTEMPHHSEEEEERMAQILQILTVHSQLRASPSNPPGRVDEVGRIAQFYPWLERGQGGSGSPCWPISSAGGVIECAHECVTAAKCAP